MSHGASDKPAPVGFVVPPNAPPSYEQTMGAGSQDAFQPGSSGGPAAGTVTLITTVVNPGPDSTHMVCPHCHNEVDSTVKTTPSTMAWLSGTLLLLLGCWMGCCLIPCCMDQCMDRDHFCPNCKQYLGRYHQ